MVDQVEEAPSPSPVVHDVPTSMRAVAKELWVAALRSGEYEQGFYFLRQGIPGTESFVYCPLGVLCDIAVQLGVVSWDRMPGSNRWFLPGGNVSVPSAPVLEWAGATGMHMSQPFPLRWSDGERYPMYTFNDRLKLSFDQIADLIEEQY